MADSDSDASSTASDTMFNRRPGSSVKVDPLRYERCYARKLLLQLSESPKIKPPQGLKPLSDWYGEYEPPSLHPANSAGAAASGRYAGRDGQPGSRRDRERGGANTASPADRFNNERDAHLRSNVGAPATGQMGDFKLAGQRPFTLPKDNDGIDALSGGGRRRQNPRDMDLRMRDGDAKERDWSTSALSADRRRQLGGEFVKKDGRAAEEGGWRSSRETMQMGRERPQRDRLERPGYGDRDARSGVPGNTDRRRQPAWMDEEESASRRDGFSGAYQRRGQNGYQPHDATPAWMADEPASNKGLVDESLESIEPRSSAKQSSSETSHVDSIQAFKAQMKEMDRKKKAQEQRELRREMGLPDLPDEELAKKSEDKTTASTNPRAVEEQSLPAPPKSVFADFLLPSSTSKDKELGKAVEERPRSSRFARMFAAEAGAAQAGDRASPASGGQSPAQASANAPHMAQSSSSNNLLAALLPGKAPTPVNHADGSSPRPQPTPTDTQSMARLMEMLHMSSAAPVPTQKSQNTNTKSPGLLQHDASGGQQQSKEPNASRPQPPLESEFQAQQRQPHDQYSKSHTSFQQAHQSHQTQAYPPTSAISPQPNREQVSSPQSRLANRSSGYNANEGNNQNQPRRQEALHAPVPPQQPSVNLLQLLAGQTSPPPGPLPTHLHNLPPPQHQQNSQRGQHMHSPPSLSAGPYLPPGGYLHDLQQNGQMASFLQNQNGSAGRPLPPPGVQASGQLQYARPPTQLPFPHQQYPLPAHQGPFQSSQQQQQQQQKHPGHLRSPSGHMNALSVLQQQQQQQRSPQTMPPPQQAYGGMRTESAAAQPLPGPQAFAQQNALAQLLAQGGQPGGPYGGMRSPSNGPHGMPPPPMLMPQHQNRPIHVQQHPAPPQQNQIDLMALLSGGNASGFAGR